MRYSKDPADLGTKLGPKLIHLISSTVVATKLKLLDTEHRARVLSMQEIIDRAGREIADLNRPLIKQAMQDRDLPPEVRQYLERTVAGTHQWHSIAGSLILQTGVGGPISNILNNYLAQGVRKAVSFNPQLTPPPETMAMMGVRGGWDMGLVYDLSGGEGYSRDIVDALIETSRSYPDVDTVLQLLRRNLISHADAELSLTRNGIPPHLHGPLLALARQPITPADLADMVVRGIRTEQEGAAGAAAYGVDAADFSLLVRDTGEPLALMQLLEAKRRGFISQAQLEHGIRQSRIRDEWIPTAVKLAYSPMSVADAINATVQNHMTLARAEEIAQQNGLEPGQASILYDTAGEPLSRTEMEQLYNRGLVTQGQVEQALRESRLKNKYISSAFRLHEKVVPIYTLQRALRYNGISVSEATRIAAENGYSHADATLIVQSGVAQRTQTYKDKTVGAVESMYEGNLIPESDAASLITGMGFSKQEATFILKAAEFRRMAKAVTQVVQSVRTRYLNHRITRNQATGFLDAAGIPATQRDFNLHLWDLEREANIRHLTEAQVVKAVKLKLITEQDGVKRLILLGYTEEDAALLIGGA